MLEVAKTLPKISPTTMDVLYLLMGMLTRSLSRLSLIGKSCFNLNVPDGQTDISNHKVTLLLKKFM